MDALIGWSGLVGSTLRRLRVFDALFRSNDIAEMRGRAFDLAVCAGVRAEKWKANRDPEDDRASIARLTDVLATVRIGHLVLVSTVDVYPTPVEVDEDTPIDADSGSAYGRHRLALERFCQERFACTVLRLPGLFGPGLKKNAIFDLQHDHLVAQIHPDSTFQFYALDRLWVDIERTRAAAVPLVNITVEPTAMRDVVARAFGRTLRPDAGVQPARYDVRSKYASQFGGSRGYWYDADATLDAIQRFVARTHFGAESGAP